MIVRIGTLNISNHPNESPIPDGWAQAPELVFDDDGLLAMDSVSEPPYLIARSDEYYRAKALTEKWAAQQTARQRREAQAILSAPESETTVDQRVNAINTLRGII